ncbi:MAG TPA: hypothetical protein VFG15_30210 [Amycolatopsis sp.]|nr:hypothetical protein [Amycolatopsis sp.]
MTSYLLVKRKAFGMAPYVGRRFVYVWYFATDELGRAIASDARIAHTDGAHRGATRAHDVFADVRPPAADVADRKAPGPTLVCIGELEPEEYHDAGCREAVEHRARRRLGAPVEREEWQSNVGGEWLSGFHARALRYRFIVRNMSGRHARPSGGT